LGSTISRATDTGNFPVLLAGTIVMAAMVVMVNRLLWRRLYALASDRFSMNS
jgi:NitT/TauT family transport system permease protein